MMKRFYVNSITRDTEYDLTKGTKGSKMLYFSVHPNGEREVVIVIGNIVSVIRVCCVGSNCYGAVFKAFSIRYKPKFRRPVGVEDCYGDCLLVG